MWKFNQTPSSFISILAAMAFPSIIFIFGIAEPHQCKMMLVFALMFIGKKSIQQDKHCEPKINMKNKTQNHEFFMCSPVIGV